VVFVIEGTGDKRRIVSVGTSEALYQLAAGQEFRTAKTVPWPGWPKREMHWDEALQTELHEPYPLSPEEATAQADADAEARLLSDTVLLKAFEVIVREIDYLRPADKPARAAFEILKSRLLMYRE
jgi:hypothetical protein